MSITSDRRAALLAIVGRTGTARLRDLADELGVSMPTVRRDVVNLAEHGRLKRRHGSVDLVSGTTVRPARGGAIAMLVSSNRYLHIVAEAAGREAARRGHPFLLEHVDTAEQTQAAHQRLSRQGCVGFIYSPQWGTEEESVQPSSWLLDPRLPVVLAGRDVDHGHPLFELDSVIADHAYGMRLALDHLQQCGHRRILASINGNTPPGRLLRRFFVAELSRRALPVLDEPLFTPALGDIDGFGTLIAAIRDHRATAIVVHTDTAARVLVPLLRRHDLAVPGRVSVVAYDDIVGPHSEVSLTSISPAKHQLGVEAVSLLLRRHLRARAGVDRPPVAHLRLLPDLVVRRSTGLVADTA